MTQTTDIIKTAGRRCPKCNATIATTLRFCEQCGHSVKNDFQAPNEPATTIRLPTSFFPWYREKFAAIVRLPLPLSIAVQWMLWVCWGFAWIPIWYYSTNQQSSSVGGRQPSSSSGSSTGHGSDDEIIDAEFTERKS